MKGEAAERSRGSWNPPRGAPSRHEPQTEAFQQQACRRSYLTAWRRGPGEVTAFGARRPPQQVLWEVKRLPMKILKTNTERHQAADTPPPPPLCLLSPKISQNVRGESSQRRKKKKKPGQPLSSLSGSSVRKDARNSLGLFPPKVFVRPPCLANSREKHRGTIAACIFHPHGRYLYYL